MWLKSILFGHLEAPPPSLSLSLVEILVLIELVNKEIPIAPHYNRGKNTDSISRYKSFFYVKQHNPIGSK